MSATRTHSPRPVSIPCPDGHRLRGQVYGPATSPLTVLAVPGIAVPQRALRHVASWLAERGLRVVTFDYRGVGLDASPEARRGASLSTWAKVDAASAYRFVAARYGRPALLCHSFGGQTLALTDALHDALGAVYVASQLGALRYWSGLSRLKLELFWRLVMPVGVRLGDPLPRRLLGEPMPAGVGREWLRWARGGDWFFSEHPDARARLARLAFPILSCVGADDTIASRASVDALLDCSPRAAIVRRAIEPSALGVPRIGHFGLLRPTAEPVWEGWFAHFVRLAAAADPGRHAA